jgi:hypothetical protein
MSTSIGLSVATALVMLSTALTAEARPQLLRAVPFTEVSVEGGFWGPWIVLAREKVLPHNLKYCELEGKIDNFLKVAKQKEGRFRGAPWEDSDVYKVIEGAAYCLALDRDPELEKAIDDLIAKIAAAQQPDGYIDTYFTLVEPDKRWTDDCKHETYCAGHLIEGAIAHCQATGKRTLLDVAIRMADHMYEVFGLGKHTDVSEHEEIELALIKLWRLTGQERYLDLAKLFLERRGHREGRQPVPKGSEGGWGEVCQDHKPIREQAEIVGHAVRAMYLYSAVTDVAGLTGDQGYLDALDRIWQDVTGRKMYVTGGIGDSSLRNEGFSRPYFLPNDTAYAETCASVGMALWNQRMALLCGDAKYADIVEREIYNGLLSGVAMDGQRFFYCNRLQGADHRPPWQRCACCPTNIVRFLPSVGGYVYAHGDRAIYVNQYMAGRGTIRIGEKTVALRQETRYPWEGRVKVTVEPQEEMAFALYLRIPGWCQGPRTPDDLYRVEGKPERGAVILKLNGGDVDEPVIEKGYVRLDRSWKNGDVVELDLPMPIRRVRANPKVEADAGRVALQRGPIVYCLESVDNDRSVRNLALPPDAALSAEFRADLLGGVTVIKGTARERFAGTDAPKPVEFMAVPFYASDNRAPGYMQVWIPEDVSLAAPHPLPSIAGESAASSSFRNNDTVDALNDQIEPTGSHDTKIPRLTWWDHLGTTEWAQYDFKGPRKVRGVEVYWFDDTGFGSCRVPRSWRVLYKSGEDWKPVKSASAYGTRVAGNNRVTFKPVRTTGLRLEVRLQPSFSAGILEWRVLE